MNLAYVAPIGVQNLFIIDTALTKSLQQALLTASVVVIWCNLGLLLRCRCYYGAMANFRDEHFVHWQHLWPFFLSIVLDIHKKIRPDSQCADRPYWIIGSPKYVGVKENALAFHAFRKICSAVKKAALFEQLIKESLFNHHTITNTTQATHHIGSASLPLLGWANFSYFPHRLGVWGNRNPQKALPARRFSGRVFGLLKVGRRKAKPCTTSPAGESISLFAENYPNILGRTELFQRTKFFHVNLCS